MNPAFNICKDSAKNCGIIITDLTREAGEYLTETTSIPSYTKFKYSETVTINVLQLIKDETKTIISGTSYFDHSSQLDEAHMMFSEDGYYIVSHIILPNLQWLEKELDREESILSYYQDIYVSDGSAVYKYVNNSLEQVLVQEVVDRNVMYTTISRCDKETFSICFLNKCYIALCQQILNGTTNKCIPQSDDLKDLLYQRDFVWMTINVIKYLIERSQYFEAQSVLYETVSCNGFCKGINKKSTNWSKSSRCGCSN